jgi:hypothetical protein
MKDCNIEYKSVYMNATGCSNVISYLILTKQVVLQMNRVDRQMEKCDFPRKVNFMNFI